MSIKVESTTETKAQTVAALSAIDKAAAKVEEKSAETEKDLETQAESEPAEKDQEDETPATEEQAEEDEKEAEEDGEEIKEDKPKKPLKGFKKRIDKLSRRVSDAERERDYWKQEAMKTSKQQDVAQKVDVKPVASANGKPKADEYETHEEYVEALAEWKADQRWAEKEAKQKETQLKTEYQKNVESFQAKVQDFAKKHDDYEDVMESVDDIIAPVHVQHLLIESENGPALMYELAKNRDALAKICSLSPLAAAREIGVFEAKISSKDQPKQIKQLTTKAPAPISPVGSNTASATRKSIWDADLTQQEYEELRAKQEARKRA